MRRIHTLAMAIPLLLSTGFAYGEIPTVLTDKIRRGSGLIDVLVDVSGAELTSYLQSGSMFLGVDLNENASGNESSQSVGVAIKELELILKTSGGDLSFGEFYTNTAAMIMEAGGADAQEFYTLFGSTGSNELTSSTSGFEISSFDDVIEIKNIDVTGDIIGAELRVTFLDTARTGENEDFFDYSDGFEEFALFTTSDAAVLDAADIGLQDAPQTVSFTDYTDINEAAGAPEPIWYLLAILPVLILIRGHQHAKTIH